MDIIGILLGGIEIPIALSVFGETEKVYISYFVLCDSFKERHENYRLTNSNVYGKKNINSRCLICDENVLTGNTLFLTTQLMDQLGYKSIDYFIIRRTASNRVYHILAYKKCLDINFCKKQIKGMLFTTKYTKIRDKINRKGMFYNELFKFDLAKESIYELLFVNGEYSNESRVSCFSRLESLLSEKIRI